MITTLILLAIHSFILTGIHSQSIPISLPTISGPAPISAPTPHLANPDPPLSNNAPSYSSGPNLDPFPPPPSSPYDPPVPTPTLSRLQPGPVLSLLKSPFPSPHPSPPQESPSNPIKFPPQGIKAAYFQSFKDFPATFIDTSYFTHIYYAFLQVDPTTFQLNLTPTDLQKVPELINSLKNTPIKTILSIGGASHPPKIFSQMAKTKTTRAKFINSTIQVARQFGFDGLDLDWEFPETKIDMSKLALLYKQWRRALEFESLVTVRPRLFLTSAVYYSSNFINYGEPRAYPGRAMNLYLDWVGPMTYDYYGSWNKFTGPSAALYDNKSNLSTSYGLSSWIEAGVLASKLVMGLPLYGHTWMLQDPVNNGFGAAAIGAGPGEENDDPGILSYGEIMDFNERHNAVVNYDRDVVAYYSYAGRSWIGYDDVISVELKIQFAKELGLAGYFFWALGQDKEWTLSRLASNAWGRG